MCVHLPIIHLEKLQNLLYMKIKGTKKKYDIISQKID